MKKTALLLGALALLTSGTQLLQAQTYTVLYSFPNPQNGEYPLAGLVRDSTGNLYGTTEDGGNGSCNVSGTLGPCGTVFEVDTTGHGVVLHSFSGADGSVPFAGLVRDSAGNLYGTTFYGGDLSCHAPSGCGSVFKVDPTGNETVLYSFTGGSDGGFPESSLVLQGGILYGTTRNGGGAGTCSLFSVNGCGTVFKLNPKTGVQTVLHAFSETDGSEPLDLVRNSSTGTIYGTTRGGGNSSCHFAYSGCGIVFSLDNTGTLAVLYSFTGGSDGANPNGGLIRVGNILYGTTYYGGNVNLQTPHGAGVVFSVDTTTGKETVQYSFTGATDGGFPRAGAIRDSAGNLYGTTSLGGNMTCNSNSGCGTVFKVDTTHHKTVLHTLQGGADGNSPSAGLIRDSAGALYGTTGFGGNMTCSQGCGLVFKVTP